MRRIAIINQKGGVGKTTTTANLGAALAEQGRRVVLVDMDAQANLSLSLGIEAEDNSPTSYSLLLGEHGFGVALRPTAVPNLSVIASHIDLSGAELELASQIGREYLLRDTLVQWIEEERAKTGKAPADYVLFDCPPSLGLLSINALAAAGEVLITLQTEFLALQGMSKLVGVVQLLRKRLNPELVVTGILPCLYESRLRLAREVLGEIRKYFPGQVLPVPIRANVKLAEAPSFGQTIFQYAPDSIGAMDYRCAAREILRMEARDPDLAGLPPFREETLKGSSHAEFRVAPQRPEPAATLAARTPAPHDDAAHAKPPAKPAERKSDVQLAAAQTPLASATGAAERPQPTTVPPPKTTVAKRAKRAGKSSAKETGPVVEVPVARATPVAQPTPVARPAPVAQPAAVAQPAPVAKAAPNPRRKVGAQPAAKAQPTPVVPPPAPSRTNTPEKTLTPLPAKARPAPRGKNTPAQAPASKPKPSESRVAEPGSRLLRAEDLPPLPPDAFEILSSFGLDP